jgi:hypothetical protein
MAEPVPALRRYCHDSRVFDDATMRALSQPQRRLAEWSLRVAQPPELSHEPTAATELAVASRPALQGLLERSQERETVPEGSASAFPTIWGSPIPPSMLKATEAFVKRAHAELPRSIRDAADWMME